MFPINITRCRRIYTIKSNKPTYQEKLKQQIKENDILIFMKGTPYEPKCGFSAKTVQALIDCEAKFSYIDILENSDVR
mgnify:CR=1 FL=1